MVLINKAEQKSNLVGKIRKIFRSVVFPTICIVYAFVGIRKYTEHLNISNEINSSNDQKIDTLIDTDYEIDCSIVQDENCEKKTSDMVPNLSQFSYSLFSVLAKSENNDTSNNVLISPFSIASALSLVLSGATKDSACQTELLAALSISSPMDLPTLSSQILGSSSKLQNSKDNDGVSFKSANGIWVKDSIKPSFIKTAQESHLATAAELPPTYDTIDAYITEQTEGFISNMLEGPVDPLTQAVLVNAVHFKGKWQDQFKSKFTAEKSFYTMDGAKHKANFMFASREMDVAKDLEKLAGGSMVVLDYKTSVDATEPIFRQVSPFRALFLLPAENTPDSMNALLSSLESLGTKTTLDKSLQQLMNQRLRYRKTELLLPRFKVSWGVESLKPHLIGLGMKTAFSTEPMSNNRPKFDQMSDDPMLYIDDVLHKAVMEVTEEGTEAAAATTAIMMTRSISPPPLRVTFNRPFIMIVLHTETMTPLFMSRIDKPDFI